MHNDDRPVGRVLTRREVLALFGLTGAAFLASCVPGLAETDPAVSTNTQIPASNPTATASPAGTSTAAEGPTATTALGSSEITSLPACVVRPELTEGPYFVDEQINRTDIRSDPGSGAISAGVRLELAFRLARISDVCAPLAGAVVDVWHCDALGVYSDVRDPRANTQGQKFLRGYQVTDANGVARFTTIYPGWYPGRTVHIHFKIRSPLDASAGYEFTSQLFFEDTLSDHVFSQAPYGGRGERSPRNEGDGIFRNGGEQLMLKLEPAGDGYETIFDIGMQI